MGNRYWDKLGHRMITDNLAFMRLPYDIKGMYFELRLMCGKSKSIDGIFPLGSQKRATLDGVIDYLSAGEKGRANYIKKALQKLERAGGIKVSNSGVVKIATYEEEQGLGRTDDAVQKRAQRSKVFEDRVTLIKRRIISFVRAGSGAELDRLRNFIRLECRCKGVTADAIIDRMVADDVVVVENGCFALVNDRHPRSALPAPPAVSVDVTGAEVDTSRRTCPPETETVTEKECSYEHQLNRSDGSPPVRKLTRGTDPAGRGGAGSAERGCSSVVPPSEDFSSGDGGTYPCDIDPTTVDVYFDDPEVCAKFFCPDGDKDSWKVIRSKLKKYGDGIFRDVLREMQVDLIAGDGKRMKNHTRIFMSKFRKFKHVCQ